MCTLRCAVRIVLLCYASRGAAGTAMQGAQAQAVNTMYAPV